jgi:hypothetical protein
VNSNDIIVKDCLVTLLKPKYQFIKDFHVKFNEEYVSHWILKHGIFSVYIEFNGNASEYFLFRYKIYVEIYDVITLCGLDKYNDMYIELIVTPIT